MSVLCCSPCQRDRYFCWWGRSQWWVLWFRGHFRYGAIWLLTHAAGFGRTNFLTSCVSLQRFSPTMHYTSCIVPEEWSTPALFKLSSSFSAEVLLICLTFWSFLDSFVTFLNVVLSSCLLCVSKHVTHWPEPATSFQSWAVASWTACWYHKLKELYARDTAAACGSYITCIVPDSTCCQQLHHREPVCLHNAFHAVIVWRRNEWLAAADQLRIQGTKHRV